MQNRHVLITGGTRNIGYATALYFAQKGFHVHLTGRKKENAEAAASAIRQSCPRQCQAIEKSIRELNRLEQSGCENPDLPANCFGDLMAELLTMEENLWAPALRRMGRALGRYIYLADAAIDYDKDRRRGSYNPFLAMGMPQDFKAWEDFLVLDMAVCTDAYERLPLVQDKALLDNILYSGIWINYRKRQKESQEEQHE